MPQLESKTALKGVLTLTISVSQDELAPSLERASVELQQSRPLPGFRPGKAPLTEAKKAYGEMKLIETALKHAVPSAYTEIVEQEKLLTVGDPDIQVTKVTPAEPIQFTAEVSLLPEVKLSDYKKIREARQQPKIEEKAVDDVLAELQNMRAQQRLVEGPTVSDSRVTVDLDLKHEGVSIEGGQTKDHMIDLTKPYFIEGFTEQVLGLKAGDDKTFTITFPADHYNKMIAGKPVEVAVKVKGVYKAEPPALDDAFAASLGKFANVAELREQLKKNLLDAEEQKEDARVERVIIEKLIKDTKFGDIPPLLLEAELKKMFARTQERLEREGGNWQDYLTHLKKTEEDLAKEWLPEAVTRVKAALIVRAISEAEDITVPPNEVAAEQAMEAEHYKDDEQVSEYIQSRTYLAHLRHMLLTRKVMERLKEIAATK